LNLEVSTPLKSLGKALKKIQDSGLSCSLDDLVNALNMAFVQEKAEDTRKIEEDSANKAFDVLRRLPFGHIASLGNQGLVLITGIYFIHQRP